MYQRVHPSRVMGWWLVLLVNYAVIGNGSNMRWSITFYETQKKQSDIFSIFSVICVRQKQELAGSVTQNVTKLSFASVRMCDCKRLSAHNLVDFCLQTTPSTSEVLRCRSPSRWPQSSLTRQTLRKRDVEQSPLLYVSGVNYNVNSKYSLRSIWHNSAADFYRQVAMATCRY